MKPFVGVRAKWTLTNGLWKVHIGPHPLQPLPWIATGFLFCIAVAGCGTVQPGSPANHINSPAQIPLSINVRQDATGQLVLEWSGTATLTYDIYIDDTPYFRQSIFHQTLNATSLTLDPTDTGLATGVNYYARVVQEDNANTAGTSFRLNVESWNEPAFSYAYAKESWQHSGRVWMEPTCGVAWDSSKPGWKVIEPWS